MAKLYNRYLDPISWQDGRSCSFIAGSSVDVWRINIPANLPLMERFLAVMNPGEIARSNKYFHSKDKNRFIVARGGMRFILANYLGQDPSTLTFAAGVNQKPYAEQTAARPVHFNISHSGDWVLLAVAQSEVGADAELINDSFQYQDIIAAYFSTSEISFINQQRSTERFFSLWTRKEAFAKATGSGLDEYIKAIPCLDGEYEISRDLVSLSQNWILYSFNLSEQYAATIACQPPAASINFWDINFKTTIF